MSKEAQRWTFYAVDAMEFLSDCRSVFLGSHAEIKLPDFRIAVFPVVGCLGICLTHYFMGIGLNSVIIVKFKTAPKANKKE